MRQNNLELAVRAAHLLEEWGAYGEWAARLGVTHEELDAFAHAAKIMYLPYDETLGINPQDDSFLQKPIWDPGCDAAGKFPHCCSIIIPCSCIGIRYANRRIPCWHMCFLKCMADAGDTATVLPGTMRRLPRTTLLCPTHLLH